MSSQLKKLTIGLLIALFIAACSDTSVPTEVPDATFIPESEVNSAAAEGLLEMEVSSVSSALDRPEAGACFFAGADYTGQEICYEALNPDAPSGFQFDIDIIDADFNDVASSVLVDEGYTVEMYSDADQGGIGWSTSSDINYLGLLVNPGGTTRFDGDNFNDQMSSLRIIKE